MLPETTEHSVQLGDHHQFYLASGPEDGPLLIFVHGWPELSLSWRHQLPAFGALGFRAIAPDLRGYGRSTAYRRHEDYAQSEVVGDMIGLLDALDRDRAVWIGHDWGAPTVWMIAAHHPDRCHGVANLNVPYASVDRGWEAMLPLVDRDVYPEETYPLGQWEYMGFYQEQFDVATAAFDANPYNVVKMLFRKGNPAGVGKLSGTSQTRINGGWFGEAAEAPDVPRDADVVTEADLRTYAEALARNSFFGPDSYYMNHDANRAYAMSAPNEGRLAMPVLFLHGRYDFTCETVESRMADPMRELCSDLTEHIVDSGHWMAQEKPAAVNAALAAWLARKLPHVWPEVR